MVLVTLFAGSCDSGQKAGMHGGAGAPFAGAHGMTRRIDIDRLQAQLMGFADGYMIQAVDMLNRLKRSGTTEEIRLWATRSRLNTNLALMTIATDPNPIVGALNATVFATLRTVILETYWIPTLLHEEGEPLLAGARQQEAEAWRMVGTFLTPQEQQELRNLMAQWRKDNPEQRYVSHVRFDDFVAYRISASRNTGPSSIFQLLFLDPFAGADPIATEMRAIRQLSERVFFFVERAPMLITLTADTVFANLATTPEMRRVLGAVDQVGAFSGSVSTFVDTLPQVIDEARSAAMEDAAKRIDAVRIAALDDLSQRIATERSAAIEQMSRELDHQREALIASIDGAQQSLQPTLVEVRQLLVTLEQASVAVREGSEAFAKIPDAWAGDDEPGTPVGDDESTLATITQMFESTRAAAVEMRALLDELEQVSGRNAGPDGPLAAIGASAVEASDALVGRLLRAGLILVGALGVVLIVAPLIRRSIERGLFGRQSAS